MGFRDGASTGRLGNFFIYHWKENVAIYIFITIVFQQKWFSVETVIEICFVNIGLRKKNSKCTTFCKNQWRWGSISIICVQFLAMEHFLHCLLNYGETVAPLPDLPNYTLCMTHVHSRILRYLRLFRLCIFTTLWKVRPMLLFPNALLDLVMFKCSIFPAIYDLNSWFVIEWNTYTNLLYFSGWYQKMLLAGP